MGQHLCLSSGNWWVSAMSVAMGTSRHSCVLCGSETWGGSWLCRIAAAWSCVGAVAVVGFVLVDFQHVGLVPQLVLGPLTGLGLELGLGLKLVQEPVLELVKELGLVGELGLEVAQWLWWEDLWWLLGGLLVWGSFVALVGAGYHSCHS